MTTEDQVASGNKTDEICLSSLKKHWAEAQIDGLLFAESNQAGSLKFLRLVV
jgi:hypothetical protein